MSKFFHIIKVLKGLNWKWVYHFYGKRLNMYGFYFWSKLRGQTYFEISIDGANLKLGFNTPYHHLFARSLEQKKHEPVTLSMFKKAAETVESGKAIFDFGGYNGVYGLLGATVNPLAKVLIVEPDPVNAKQIQANIDLSGLKNVQVIQAAVGEKSGAVKFAFHSGATAGKITANVTTEVKSLTLADCVREIGSIPALIKFDVVGAEQDALLAASELLKKTDNLDILLELYPRPEIEKKQLTGMFKELGFKMIFLYPRSDGGSVYYWVFKK